MSGSTFFQAVYASAATKAFGQQELKDLLIKARKNNAALGITGLLLYESGSFLQVLEGPIEPVTMMLDRIAKDPRHQRVVLLLKRQIAERAFAEWEMGLLDVSAKVFATTEGLSDFLRGGPIALTESGKVERFLDGFRSGNWRQFIK